MNALGMIETKGLIACIEAADIMTKTSEVTLKGIVPVGDGLVTVMIVGELEAVRASVNAGAAAAERIGTVVLTHVIPRPNKEVESALAAVFHLNNISEPDDHKACPLAEEKAENADCAGQEPGASVNEKGIGEINISEDDNAKTAKAIECQTTEEEKAQDLSVEISVVKEADNAGTDMISGEKPVAETKNARVKSPAKKHKAAAKASAADLSAYEGMTVSELRAKAREMNVETLSRKDIRFAKKDILLKAIAAHLSK